jgi:ribosomal-protein-alanine N-acetyltransferase
MREGNPAAELYRRHGFEPVGRRPNYYNRGSITGIDAITFAKPIT